MARKNVFSSKPNLLDKLNDEETIENFTTSTVEAIENNIQQIKMVEPDKLIPFYNKELRLELHDGEKYERLKESISVNGFIEPVLCTYNGSEELMILSGHNRTKIAKELNIKVPVIIKENLTEEQMNLIVIDTNLLNRQLEDMPPTKLAYILQIKNEAEKHQGKKMDEITSKTLGETYKLSSAMIKRYLKLNSLCESAKRLVDSKSITLKVAYELAFFDKEIQEFFIENGIKFKDKDLHELRVELNQSNLNTKEEKINFIKAKLFDSTAIKKQIHKLDYRNIKKYIPDSINDTEIEGYVIRALKAYNGS